MSAFDRLLNKLKQDRVFKLARKILGWWRASKLRFILKWVARIIRVARLAFDPTAWLESLADWAYDFLVYEVAC